MGVENDNPRPRDPATVLQRDFTVRQVSNGVSNAPRYRMSDRNRRKLERMRQLVEQLRNR